MLSQTSEHALRAALYLAQHPAGTLVTADAIAGALGAPRNYMAKTLNALAKQGIVASLRGPRGGFRLAISPDKLTLARVVDSFEETRINPICMLGGRPCTDATPCRAHARWKAISLEAWRPLETTTVADLLSGDGDQQDLAGNAGTPRSHRQEGRSILPHRSVA
jgi:Rrf2 family transcriptional regulator, iron-sulfur cluster assembly transcription factor